MLRLIAYDISDPKRLRLVAETCEDYGTRVQYSLFECWLEEPAFLALWEKLGTLIDPEADRLVAYTLDKTSASRRLTRGADMRLSQATLWFVA